jgi:hypothetical protein
MPDIFLKNNDGAFWKSTDDKLFKAKDFNTIPLGGDNPNSKLTLWVKPTADTVTLVDGRVSELRDYRGKNLAMMQGTATARPEFLQNENVIYIGDATVQTLSLAGQNVRSMFIVMSSQNAVNRGGIGISQSDYLGFNGNFGTRYTINSATAFSYYRNGVKYTDVASNSANTLYVLHTLANFSKTNVNFVIGSFGGYYYKIHEAGFYSTLLTEQEVIYNQIALMRAYNLI